jgi:hypothetical protein
MDWLHIYIAGAAFLVFALVALVLLVSFQQVKVDMDHGPLTYVKFVWANFLKPHDSSVEGQQGALESFYKTQVCESLPYGARMKMSLERHHCRELTICPSGDCL